MEDEKDEKLWVYKGDGAFIDGIPARNLTEQDWARLDEDARAAVAHSGLYRRAARPAKEEQPPAKHETPAVESGKRAADKDAKE